MHLGTDLLLLSMILGNVARLGLSAWYLIDLAAPTRPRHGRGRRMRLGAPAGPRFALEMRP